VQLLVTLAFVSRHHSLSALVTLAVFTLLFLFALRFLADPGEDWNMFTVLVPLVCPFFMILGRAGKATGWEPMLLSYLLGVFATWLTAGPWMGLFGWRRVVLASITPLFYVLSSVIGGLVQRWLPVLMLK
jgi:hypothetical protein